MGEQLQGGTATLDLAHRGSWYRNTNSFREEGEEYIDGKSI